MRKLDEYIEFWPEFEPNTVLDEESLCFIYDKNKIMISIDEERVKLPLKGEVKGLDDYIDYDYYLGIFEGKKCFAIAVKEGFKIPEGYRWNVINDELWLNDKELYFIAIKGNQLLGWDQSSAYCGYCGGKNERKVDERAKVCSKCGKVLYPRISPAVIVGVKKDKEILLAHNVHFKEGLYSIIAGFVEQGETLEEAVKREVYEEIGIKVKNIQYVSSKPWSSGDSLMMGFTAEYESGEIQVDGMEISDAGWYSKENLPKVLPLKVTTAREIIDEVLGL